MNKRFIISGIGTEVGKTVVSAIIAEALHADYWKPLQAGDLHHTDSMKVMELTENVNVLPERFKLLQPMSPHAAAERDKIVLWEDDFNLPEAEGNLVVEGAGGLLVPLNHEGLLFADLFARWNLPVIIVSRHYLGSINHSLLTAEVLKNRGIEIAGFVFVGEENRNTEEIILRVTGLKMIARIPETAIVHKEFILEQAEKLKEAMNVLG